MTDNTIADNPLHVEAMKRFESARSGWSERRRAAEIDLRAVNVKGGQWDKGIAAARNEAGRPALEFNELHTYVQRVVNQARKDRPQPKVSPGDEDATEETSEFLESRLRHIQYASQADVAYDTAVEAAATGGFGFYRITKEHSDTGARSGRPSFDQEPRIRRILDPMTQYPDPACKEPDYSDARFWFSREWMDRDAFQREFHKDPISFEGGAHGPDEAWNKEDQVCIAEYWHVEESTRQFVALEDGTQGYRDELESVDEAAVLNEREVIQRKVVCHLIDGEKVLRETKWEGQWIPIIPVLGREVVVDGVRHLISIVRFAVDPQKLKNAYKSGIADSIQSATLSPWIGATGQFKDPRWKDAHKVKYAYLEYENIDVMGKPVGPPIRNGWEAPIQALSEAALQETDDIKRAVGYADAINAPSKSQLSGIAVQRRSEQSDLTNFHFEDNLIRSQWHCARVVLDLELALVDTPRVLKGRKEDGSTFSQAVTMPSEDGQMQQVPGREDLDHMRLDIGRYDVAVVSQPSYATRKDEEKDALLAVIQANPQEAPAYNDLLFKAMGYGDLQERAELLLPPPIQQAIAAKKGGADPAMLQNQLAQAQGQLQQAQQQLQQLAQIVQTKQVEGANKLQAINAQGSVDIEKHKLQLIADVLKQSHEHGHEAAAQLSQHGFDAAKHTLDLTHQTASTSAQLDQQQQQAEMAQQNQGASQ